MKHVAKIAAAALIGLGVVSIGATSASAAVACNGEGECWHVHRNYAYQPGFGISVHPNNWRWGANDHYRWHEHAGRGYWRSGAWVGF